MKRRWKIRNPQFRAFLYLLPALSVIAVFQFYPVLKSFFMGFYTKFDYLTDTVEAVGLDNFLYVLKDPEFALAMKNTAVFAVISVPLGIITALVFALILNSNIRFQKFFQKCIFSSICHIDDRSGCCVAVDAQQRLWNGQCTSLSAWDAKSSVAYRCADDHPDLDCIKCVERAWL